jgi:hypothetical protein
MPRVAKVMIVISLLLDIHFAQVFNEIMSANITSIRDEYEVDMQNCPVTDCDWWYEQMGRFTCDGDYPDWIELYNPDAQAIDLTGYGLSDNPASPYKWEFPHTILAPGGHLLVFASGKNRREADEVDHYMHTNFKIDRKGETIILTDKFGGLRDQIDIGEIPVDFSLGRYPDGGSEWKLFSQPTPADENDTVPFKGFNDSIYASHAGGFYAGNIVLSLSTVSTNPLIYFTLDGSDPTIHSTVYTTPISITQTTVVKAKTFENGIVSSRLFIQTYFINEQISMPVISIAIVPENLWDADIGIYVPGDNADEDNRIANYWQDWERPAHLAFFEQDGRLGFDLDVGLKIFGWASRRNALKSLAVMIRDRYGQNKLNYQIFPDLPVSEFKSFVLRAAGNDWQGTFFRDPLAVSLIVDKNLDVQAFRPAIVFINGVYWGIHNIREKLNEDYLASHHQIDENNVDIISRYWRRTYPVVSEGDAVAYLALEKYLKNNSLDDPEHYRYISEHIDIDNYITYCVSQIYFANYDWPGNNNKCWCSKTTGGKWRWLLYDLDYTLGSNTNNDYRHNTLEHATMPNGTGWPNPDFTTFLLRKMLTSTTFKNAFINRFADFMNTVLTEDTVLKKIDQMKQRYESEMKRHIDQWGSYGTTLRTITDWQNNITVLKTFASNRKDYVCRHICDKFGLNGWHQLHLNIWQSNSGKIRINSIMPEKYPWQGAYFSGIAVHLSALAHKGYRFSYWQGSAAIDSLSSTITVQPSQGLSLTAVFERDSTAGINGAPDIPFQFTLEHNYPNPFNPQTDIGYSLPETAIIQLDVFDLAGRRIRALVKSRRQSRGSYMVRWSGKDDFDRKVASGIYIYRLKAHSSTQLYSESKKMVLLK